MKKTQKNKKAHIKIVKKREKDWKKKRHKVTQRRSEVHNAQQQIQLSNNPQFF